MTFISFAQNYEDLVLWRALRHVENGFYIDVGAWSPDVDSVTKAFSERGWRGINIEPNPAYFSQCMERRPRDVNLRVAVGDQMGTANMWLISDTGLSTADSGIASRHALTGRDMHAEQVPMVTLAAIWQEHVQPQQPVHFLKVDVEGFEKHVLQGNDWVHNRPWIVVVEATLPLSQVENHFDWEPLLLEAAYQHAYSDGLNRFYVAQEHTDLLSAFKYPPSVFDDFVSSRYVELGQELGEARADSQRAHFLANSLKHGMAEKESLVSDLRQSVERAEAKKNELEQSIATRAEQQSAALLEAVGFKGRGGSTISELHQQLSIVTGQYQAIVNSTAWQATTVMRRLAAKLPASLRRQMRRAMRLAWWTVTPWRSAERWSYLQNREKSVRPPAPPVMEGVPPEAEGSYATWIREVETRSGPCAFPDCQGPYVSLLLAMPADNEHFSRTVASLQAQQNRNWELIVAIVKPLGGGAHQAPGNLEDLDDRVHLIAQGFEERAAALQACLHEAKGQFVSVLDAGDALAHQAFDAIASALHSTPEADIFYGDEDRCTPNMCRELAYFKPEWSPDLLYAFNYFGRITLIRKVLLENAGGFDPGAGAGVEWDAHLRTSDLTDAIHRIPKVLCHRWSAQTERDRPLPDSAEAADLRRVIENYWHRHDIAALAFTEADGTQRVQFDLNPLPLVSIIVPTKNKPELISMCINGLLYETEYSNKEIIIVDTGSTDEKVLQLYDKWKGIPEIKILNFNRKFNYSAACNFGAVRANGTILLFLNNDIEFVQKNWLMDLVGFAARPGVGVVGTKLIFPSLRLQHGGVALGIHQAALMYRDAGPQWGVFGSPDHPRNWMAIMGACQLVTRKAFEQVGGFDESYEIAMSDVALCMRTWRAGYRTAYAPSAMLVHHEGASRGHSNPVADTHRLACEMWALGTQEDPYLHPELDGQLAIPTLRRPGSPGTRDAFHSSVLAHDGLPLPAIWRRGNGLDLTNDGECVVVTELSRNVILWAPQSAHKVQDIWSLARWCLDLLRSDLSTRARFPRALTEGMRGGFAQWLLACGAERFGLPSNLDSLLQTLFETKISARCRQIFLFRDDLQKQMPHGLTPAGSRQLFQWFQRHGRVESSLRAEEIWWLFWEAHEQPEVELQTAYKFCREWQTNYPDALTVFGRLAFVNWFQRHYGAEGTWASADAWKLDYSPEQQIRVAYGARADWQEKFPRALVTETDAINLIEWLKTYDGAGDPAVRDWCRNLETDSVATGVTRLGVNVLGHFCYPSGLRISAEALVAGLQGNGVSTTLRDVKSDVRDDPCHVQFEGFEEYDITILHTQPEPFFDTAYERTGLIEKAKRPYRIAYWYWEFDSIPDYWISKAAAVDEVWTATEFIAKGLREKLSVPVRTIFPGVQLGPFKRRDRGHFGLPDNEFVFLFTFHMMSIMERKNPIGLIAAFKKAFGAQDDGVRLVLKTSFGKNHPEQLQNLHDLAKGSNVTIIDAIYSPDEILSLMDTCDAYVSLHRSEGLGLTIAEAMLMGKPVICTNYSGNVDFANEQNSLPVGYKIVKLGRPIPPYDAESEWADPSVDEAAQHMRRLFDDREFARQLGARGRRSAEENLSIQMAGKKAVERLQEIREMRRHGSDASPAAH